MRTRRILSNISFNSLEYFEYVIHDLQQSGLIDWAYWIQHKGDKDDKKEHIHFCFQPSYSIDTVKFNKHFIEFPFHGNRLPRKPTIKYMPVVSLDDWLLYCKHDKDYLLSKCLDRRYFYSWSDFGSTDLESFEHDINNIDSSKINRLSFLREGVLQRIPFAQLIQEGKIPIAYRSQYEAQYIALQRINKADKIRSKMLEEGEQIDWGE